ncbi:MAG TPA: MerR family DNA-binding transcriptional regulator [Gemmataceae bacterium]|nr:MerR family DNA-binding transcriptional regulator [Gemmataceae bacterium]
MPTLKSQPPPPADRLLNMGEVARALRVSTRTLRRYMRRGLVPAPLRFSGQKFFWRESAVKHLLAEREAAAEGKDGAPCPT